MQCLTYSINRAGEWKNQAISSVFKDPKGLYLSASHMEIQEGKAYAKKKKEEREAQGCGQEELNLSQPDIGGHDLPLCWEREAAEKCPLPPSSSTMDSPTPSQAPSPRAQAGTPEELVPTYSGYFIQ